MSLIDVRNAFDLLFQSPTLLAITPNVYSYEILENSNHDIRKYRHDQKVNFFIFIVTKSIEFKLMGCEQETYQVDIKYYKEDDKAGLNQNQIRDIFEAIHEKIRTVIGKTWLGSVDYYQPLTNQITLQTIQLDDKPTWLGSFSYKGFKQILI